MALLNKVESMEIKTEIDIEIVVEDWKSSFNDQNRTTQSDLYESGNSNDVMNISVRPAFS